MFHYEGHVFKQITRKEIIDRFLARLYRQSVHCNFGNVAVEKIRDKVVEKCHTPRMRRVLLEQGHNLNLQRVQES